MVFSENLAYWYIQFKRDLPWRNTSSPYCIWLSEVILQQTRVNQGIHYYLRFIERFPAIEDLAKTPLDDVLKLWQGLGYYTRARNLHETAKLIVSDFGGRFPENYAGLIRLKGIGSYTASAIASIAFNEAVPVVDGNVLRVLARFYGNRTAINSKAAKKTFTDLAEHILDPVHPGLHNQAMMELGALVCSTRNPDCRVCPLNSECYAFLNHEINELPVKSPKRKSRTRHFYYFHITYKGKTFMKKRNGSDIWHSLYEFPLIETDGPVPLDALSQTNAWEEIFGKNHAVPFSASKTYKHQLTHQTIISKFYRTEINQPPESLNRLFASISADKLYELAVPRLIERYLEDTEPEMAK
jgi:A/G-specific adenine glycosylase